MAGIVRHRARPINCVPGILGAVDPVTHTLAGVVLGRALFGGALGRAAVPALALASNLPDIDAAVMLSGDPEAVLWRRTFGHSVLLLPLWAFGLAAALKRFYPETRAPVLYGAILAGSALHLLFDLINSFGVVLLWPLSDWRPELATVFIIDLILTGLLAAPILLARVPRLRARRTALARAALAAVAAYLLFCAAQRAESGRLLAAAVPPADSRPDFAYVVPEPLGPHRWRGVLRNADRYRVYLIHSLAGRAELRQELTTAAADPAVATLRAGTRGRRLEWFFKAPVWELERHAAGPPSAAVYDLRFTPLVIERGRPFLFRFRLDSPAADLQPGGG
jgi:inner membrane protein